MPCLWFSAAGKSPDLIILLLDNVIASSLTSPILDKASDGLPALAAFPKDTVFALHTSKQTGMAVLLISWPCYLLVRILLLLLILLVGPMYHSWFSRRWLTIAPHLPIFCWFLYLIPRLSAFFSLLRACSIAALLASACSLHLNLPPNKGMTVLLIS